MWFLVLEFFQYQINNFDELSNNILFATLIILFYLSPSLTFPSPNGRWKVIPKRKSKLKILQSKNAPIGILLRLPRANVYLWFCCIGHINHQKQVTLIGVAR